MPDIFTWQVIYHPQLKNLSTVTPCHLEFHASVKATTNLRPGIILLGEGGGRGREREETKIMPDTFILRAANCPHYK